MKAGCRQGGFFVCQATARWMTNLLLMCRVHFRSLQSTERKQSKPQSVIQPCIVLQWTKCTKSQSGWPALALGLAAVHNMDDQLQLCIAPRRLTLFLSKINGKATGYSSPTANICFPVNACFATKYSGGINLDFCKFFFGRSVQLHATSHPS